MVEKEEVKKLAKLSKLTFTEEEIDRFTTDMQSIISFADMINQADCDEGGPLSVNSAPPLRQDQVKQSYGQEEILNNAPTAENGYFLIPRRTV